MQSATDLQRGKAFSGAATNGEIFAGESSRRGSEPARSAVSPWFLLPLTLLLLGLGWLLTHRFEIKPLQIRAEPPTLPTPLPEPPNR